MCQSGAERSGATCFRSRTICALKKPEPIYGNRRRRSDTCSQVSPGFWADEFDLFSQGEEQIFGEPIAFFSLARYSPRGSLSAPRHRQSARLSISHNGHKALGIERHEAIAYGFEYSGFIGEPAHDERDE